jgi:type I restriction enzyme S subunit
MEVRARYKQTEIGAIPEDWDIEVVADAFEIRNQLRFPISQAIRERMAGPYPYYGPTSVQGWINEYRVEGEHALIGEDGDHFLKWRDQSMTLLVDGKFNVNNHAHIVRGRKNLTAWFYWFFSNRDISSYLTRQGAGRYKLSKAALQTLPCALPRPPEQRAIATALSDVDGLLGGLGLLIAKKRDIKQAAMQQLLTGKTRLPGFNGEWKSKKLGEICDYVDGVATPGGDFGYVEIGDVNVETKSYDVAQKEKLSVLGAVKVPSGTLLISTVRPTRGAIAITKSSLHVSSAFCRVRPKNDLLFHLVCQPKFLSYLGENSFGGTYPTCRDETILGYETALPSDPAEQIAIAKVLTEMDAELAGLEQKREKTHALKQAMMQELLTGRTRLV